MENSLANKKPWLVAEWSERNGSISPDDVSYGSKNYIGGMAVVAMSGRPAQRQDQAARIARFAVTPESLRVSMTLRV